MMVSQTSTLRETDAKDRRCRKVEAGGVSVGRLSRPNTL